MTEMGIQISTAQFEQISDIVYKHCGINLHEGKRELVQARIAKRMRVRALTSPTDYMRLALDDSEEFTHLIDALSTNLTSFFREGEHFVHLEKVFLPELLERKRKSGRQVIRAWSAGCSTGEEPYTIGMVLLSALNAVEWDIKILATDLSTAVLAKAREGIYDAARLKTIPPQLRSRFCPQNATTPSHAGQMSAEIRKVITFAQLNLMQPWPFRGPFDFIFCRNVMIYFDKPTQQKLINRYYDMLSDGGLLFTGHSESLTGISHPFKYVQPTIYAKG